MAKFTDAVVTTLKGHFEAGDQPTEAQFAALIDAIQQGIEEHDHDGTGDGDGIADLGPLDSLEMAEDAWIGIGVALERLVFNGGDGAIAVMGANLGVGILVPEGPLHVFGGWPTATLERTTADTNVKQGSCVLKTTTTGDMADGFGPEYLFAIEDDAAVNNYIAKLGAVRSGADNTGAFFIDVYSGGAATERLRIESTGVVKISNLAGAGTRNVSADANGNLVIA